MDAKVFLVSGATGGLGKATAIMLALQGHQAILLCRDEARGQAVQQEILERTGKPVAHLILADLAHLASIRRACAEILERFPHLDGLVHTAAVYTTQRTLTADGCELMFAVNHLAVFEITRLLLERLKDSSPSRVLVATAPSTVKLDFADLQGAQKFNSLRAFGATKMANLLFSAALARQHPGNEVASNAFHPGIFKSGLMKNTPAPLRWLTSLVGSPPEKPAADLAYLASASEQAGATGQFFRGRASIEPDPYARDEDIQQKLWQSSLALVGAAG